MSSNEIDVFVTENGDPFWDKTKEPSKTCSWAAGPRLCRLMDSNAFKNQEKVFIAVADKQVVGFSTFTEKDCIPITTYGPFIGFVFVVEAFRGKKIGQKMVDSIAEYASSLGYRDVYVASNESGLYEKMGFQLVDRQLDYWGNSEQIFMRKACREFE